MKGKKAASLSKLPLVQDSDLQRESVHSRIDKSAGYSICFAHLNHSVHLIFGKKSASTLRGDVIIHPAMFDGRMQT